MSNWYEITGATGATTISDGYRIIVDTPAGTTSRVTIPIEDSKSQKRISPKLYFKYVKSKLKELEQTNLKQRLIKLQELSRDAFDLKQEALYQEFSKMVVKAVREQEAAACGYTRWVHAEDIHKFRSIAMDDGATKTPIYFDQLENFPRHIPVDIKCIIHDVKSKNLFNELWILYLDYTHEELKTNKDKIKEKDPILFGRFSFDKDRFFYITDWVDDYCDLTLEKFVEKAKIETNTVSEIDHAYIERLKREVEERQARLDSTNANNFKELMKEEERPSKKAKWYHRFRRAKK